MKTNRKNVKNTSQSDNTTKQAIAKFSKKASKIWKNLQKFMVEDLKLSDEQQEKLCGIIDSYVDLNNNIIRYTVKNKLNENRFFEDVENKSFS